MHGREKSRSDLNLPVRNVALVGHRGSGKTTLVEAILAIGGAIRQRGSVDNGTSLMDFDPIERKRQLSLQTGFGWIHYKETHLNIYDVPGTEALRFERTLAISSADVVVIVVDAAGLLPIGAEEAMLDADRVGVPTLIFVNRMDIPHEIGRLLERIAAVSDGKGVCIEAPLGDGASFSGVVDLLTDNTRMRQGFEPPRDLAHWMSRSRENLYESVALTDDEMLQHYLEYSAFPDGSLIHTLREAVEENKIIPILFGSALSGFGVESLLQKILELTPCAQERRGPALMEYDGTLCPIKPDPTGGFIAQVITSQIDSKGEIYTVVRVWRGRAKLNQTWINGDTNAQVKVRRFYKLRGPRRAKAQYLGPGAVLAIWDDIPGRPGATFSEQGRQIIPPPEHPPAMMTLSLSTQDKKDEDKLDGALQTLRKLDGALSVRTDEVTGNFLVEGTNEAHLDLCLERVKTKLNLPLRVSLPAVPYRETPKLSVERVEGIHRVEDGDGLALEFGACVLDLGPGPLDLDLGFEDVFTDAEELPTRFRPAITDGVRAAFAHGPTAGYPVLGASVRLTGGTYDILQSTTEHFHSAGANAARNALRAAGTRILEPWWHVDVYTPNDGVGDTISEVSSRRGRIVGLEVIGEQTRVLVNMPFGELRTFGKTLLSVTSGRGRYLGDFSHYEPIPDNLVGAVVANSPFHKSSSAQ